MEQSFFSVAVAGSHGNAITFNERMRVSGSGIQVADGSPSEPSYAFKDDLDTGFYRGGDGQLHL